MAQLIPLPLTVSCSNEIQIGFTFLVLAYPGNPGQNPESCKTVVCVCVLYDKLWNSMLQAKNLLKREELTEIWMLHSLSCCQAFLMVVL